MDSNNVLKRFSEGLTAQNSKGLEKYNTSLVDANLSELELLQHAKEEVIDLWQYLCVLEDKLNDKTRHTD